jgi:hypothetical protein
MRHCSSKSSIDWHHTRATSTTRSPHSSRRPVSWNRSCLPRSSLAPCSCLFSYCHHSAAMATMNGDVCVQDGEGESGITHTHTHTHSLTGGLIPITPIAVLELVDMLDEVWGLDFDVIATDAEATRRLWQKQGLAQIPVPLPPVPPVLPSATQGPGRLGLSCINASPPHTPHWPYPRALPRALILLFFLPRHNLGRFPSLHPCRVARCHRCRCHRCRPLPR